MERYTSDRISWENQKRLLIQEISGWHRILEERGLCPVQNLRASERSPQCPGPTEQKGEAPTLYETLCARVEETELILARWQEHHDKAKSAWQEEMDKVQTAYENGWRAVRADLEIGKAAEFRARCEELEVGMKKKDRVIARFQSQMMALGKEHLLNAIQLSRMNELLILLWREVRTSGRRPHSCEVCGEVQARGTKHVSMVW
ncbi:uncharacterized protein PAE49_002175 [Odontesthes bonariensis]|uniref:uncharacterized protein LOC142375587 n=1 Tax=Odontesthes bonariensis TaxID=219752 RepID=UPI003F586645